MWKIAFLLPVVLLAGCESAEQKAAKWQAFCTSHEFSPKQCEVLYALKQDNEDASEANGAMAVSTGIMLGVAAGGGRR